jgi:hypothetical protein
MTGPPVSDGEEDDARPGGEAYLMGMMDEKRMRKRKM